MAISRRTRLAITTSLAVAALGLTLGGEAAVRSNRPSSLAERPGLPQAAVEHMQTTHRIKEMNLTLGSAPADSSVISSDTAVTLAEKQLPESDNPTSITATLASNKTTDTAVWIVSFTGLCVVVHGIPVEGYGPCSPQTDTINVMLDAKDGSFIEQFSYASSGQVVGEPNPQP